MIKFLFHCLSLAGLTLALCGPAYAQIYKWTDDKGEVHFGDSPYAVKGSKGQGVVVIPTKKPPKEPEPASAMEEPTVQPTPDTKQEQPVGDKSKPAQMSGDPKSSTPPTPIKKEEAAKASAQPQEPVEKTRALKRVIKEKKKEEKEKSDSAPKTAPAPAPAAPPAP